MTDNRDEKGSLPGLDAFHSVRMGPGVVGRTSSVALAMILIAGLAIWSLKSSLVAVLAIVLVLLLFSIGYIAVAFWYANKHPQFATLEGSELVRYKEIEQAASSPKIVDVNAKQISNTSTLAIEDKGGK